MRIATCHDASTPVERLLVDVAVAPSASSFVPTRPRLPFGHDVRARVGHSNRVDTPQHGSADPAADP
jgi:hypothetical protein